MVGRDGGSSRWFNLETSVIRRRYAQMLEGTGRFVFQVYVWRAYIWDQSLETVCITGK